ncbi:reverse transcriptase domain-containing protein, partial [Tanacetum coccineum]
NLVPPLENPERTIRRTRIDPNPFEEINIAANGAGNDGPPPTGGDGLPVPDLRTMEELWQPTLNGRGGPIASITIQATNFGLKNEMIQQVQNSCPFRGPGDDANKHLDKFLHVTQSMKMNGVSDDALRLYLFPYSLQHRATKWFDRLPRNSITTFDQMAKIFLEKYFPPSMVTKLRNDITNFRQEPDESLFEAWERYKLSIDRCPNHNMLPVTQIDTFYNGLTLRHRDTANAAVGALAYQAPPYQASVHQAPIPQPQVVTNAEFSSYMKANDSIVKNMQTNMTTLTNSTNDLNNMLGQLMKMNTASTSGSGTLPIVERETEVTKDTVPPTNNGGTEDVQPPVVQVETQVPNFEPVVALVVELVEAPVSAPKPNPKPSIPYPSRLNDQKLHEKANNQIEKFFQIFQDLHFDISFADAIILMPKMDVCLALADLGASINLLPLSVWKKLSLPELTPTCMTLELADRSIS